MTALRAALLLAAALRLASAAETFTYWIQPCGAALASDSGCQSGDPQLAEWALRSWQRFFAGKITISPAASEQSARLRIYWAPGNRRLYGEARPVEVGGKIGAEIYVRPDLSSLGPEMEAAGRSDPLFRHTVVYLTCLHESGHGLGLRHTANFDDIMYSFAFGGDIVEYFGRYRRKLKVREDIEKQSGIHLGNASKSQAD